MTDADLIARLESAAEGSRELDAAIKGFLSGADKVRVCDDTFTFFEALKNGEQVWLLSSQDFPHYTTSLDAALTLVPEGRAWGLDTWGTRGGNGAWIEASPSTPTVYATTPALALCAAALKARQT